MVPPLLRLVWPVLLASGWVRTVPAATAEDRGFADLHTTAETVKSLHRHQQEQQQEQLLPPWYQPNYRPQGSYAARLPFTEEVQAGIWAHQNPPSCEGRKFVAQIQHRAGLGSLLHVATVNLGWAMEHGAILVHAAGYGSHLAHGSYCEGARDFTCFFEPLSNCTRHAAAAPGTIETVDHYDHRRAMPAKWKQRWLDTPPPMDILYWWRAQAVAYIFRLNPRTAAHLAARRLLHAAAGPPLPLPPNTVSIHVRGGDKRTEMELWGWGEHLARAEAAAAARNFSERNILLSTDDAGVVARARVTEGWNMYVLGCPPRLGEGEGEGGVLECRQGGVEAADNPAFDRRTATSAELVLFSLENLLLALEATHFVGTRGSNWNRLIDELRCTYVGDPRSCCQPYVEVGCIRHQPVSEECDINSMNWR